MTAENRSLGQAILERDGQIWIVVSLVAIAFLAGSLLRTINEPWTEDDNAFGAAYAQAARNNLRAGLSVTAGVPATFYVGPLPIPADAYYVHHPVLFPLLVTASVAALGEKEWTVRLVSIVCSILSAFFLWSLVQNVMGKRAAAFVLAVFVTLPMELHYGDLVDYEPFLVMWMLAALICLRHWRLERTMRWQVFALLCCLSALWTDWPGYLFTAAVCLWLFFDTDRGSRGFAIVLLGLAAGSGAIFLLQIRHVNPEAWRDLWTAITMRLGNGIQPGSSPNSSSGTVRFGFAEWLRRILQSLDQNYLRATWGLVVVGAISLFRDRKSAGPRWMRWASLLLIAAGIPYLVIFQNWSFVHDFASFSVIGAIAILGGAGLEAIWQWVDRWSKTDIPRGVAAVATVLLLPSLAWAGSRRAEEQRSQFLILDGVSREPPNLIPDLGRYLATIFRPGTTILCNFDPYCSPVSYYAKTTMLRNVTTRDEWSRAAGEEPGNAGGILWLGAPSTPEIIATLPAGEIDEAEIDGVRFVIWRRGSSESVRSNPAR
jgi:4-amino-4-deoxy-L-arabinose transferase-like glycosyltransferase